ncbi:MAG: iron-sulfur cluster carrier protein ApbC [Acidobacteriota bacterium]
MMNNPEKQLLTEIGAISIPALNKTLAELKSIQSLRLQNQTLILEIEIPTPAERFRNQIEQRINRLIANHQAIQRLDLRFILAVPSGKEAEGKQAVPGIKNIIAVSSGKGGVGKSTIAVNLAVSLAQWGAKVGLLDTDVYGPNVPIMVGVDQDPIVQGQKLVPHTAYSVKVMSIGFLNRGDKPVVWRGPMLHTAVRQFLYDVLWGELDYLIVDMPPGTGDAQLSLAQLVPVQGAIVVTTPQEVSMSDVRKAINMFEQVHIPILGVVENMSYFMCNKCAEKHYIFGTGGGEELARKFNIKLLGQVPLATNVREGGDAGLPVVVGDKGSPQATALTEIAENVAMEIVVKSLSESRLPVINLGDSRGDSFSV